MGLGFGFRFADFQGDGIGVEDARLMLGSGSLGVVCLRVTVSGSGNVRGGRGLNFCLPGPQTVSAKPYVGAFVDLVGCDGPSSLKRGSSNGCSSWRAFPEFWALRPRNPCGEIQKP